MIVCRSQRKPSTKPRSKSQPRKRSREESYPESLHDHLAEHVPGFRDLPPKVRHSLAYLAWIAGTGRRRHNTFADSTTIHYRELERLFGRGGVKKVNDVVAMFDGTEEPHTNVGGVTRGYRFTAAVADVMDAYLNAATIEPTHLATTDGKRVRKRPRAIASKDSDGHTQRVWRDTVVVNVVPVDIDQLYALRHRLMRELVELKAGGDPNSSSAIESKRYRLDALNHLLRLANTHVAGVGNVMMRYTVCSTGRLFGDGVSLQNVPREVRNAALHGLWDYDIENCHFAIFQQMAARRGRQTPAIAHYLANKEAVRRGIAERVGITYEEVKESLLAAMYGAPLSLWEDASIRKNLGKENADRLFKDPEFKALDRDIKAGRRAILAAYPKGKRVTNAVGLSIEASATREKRLAHLLQGVEVMALRAVQGEYPKEIVLLMHDGFVSTDQLDTKRLEEIIRDATGFDLRLSEKRIADVEGDMSRDRVAEDGQEQQGKEEREQPSLTINSLIPLGRSAFPTANQ
jgi:hypothetical protein